MTETIIDVVGRVDTRHAAVVETLRRVPGTREFQADGSGYRELIE